MSARRGLIIGVTGGIGSGKTATTDEFSRLGVVVVDADQVSRDVVNPGTEALARIAQRFGSEILTDDGQLQRRLLRDIIFSNADEKQWLESVLHPLIREEIIRRLQQSRSAYTILVSPLLLETSQHKLCDRVLLVDAPESLQLLRTRQRDQTSDAAVKAIMDQQMGREQRLAMADDVIVNDAGLTKLHEAVRALHRKYLTLAAGGSASRADGASTTEQGER